MLTIGSPLAAPERPLRRMARQVAGSTALHIVIVFLCVGTLFSHSRWVAPYRLPGTDHGHNLVVTYVPDRAEQRSAEATAKPIPAQASTKSPPPKPTPQQAKPSKLPTATASASPHPESSTTGTDALGTGDITIALTSYFPPPHPDLSALPHGTKGNVILDVVIDTNGKISDLKKMSGLGYGIDETVIATVLQWTFHPALQNGHPVASEQELHFHYEKG